MSLDPAAAAPADPSHHTLTGLTQAEAEARYVPGQDNSITFKRGRSRLEIVKEALLSAYTFDLLTVSIALFWLGQTASAIWSIALLLVLFFFNLSLAFRSKAQLETVMARTRPEATVIRDSQVRAIDPNLIVPGDLAIVGPGDQLFADGRLQGDEPISVDESWLTGNLQPVQRHPGDSLLAGSFCINGHGLYLAEVVGDERQVTAVLEARDAQQLPPTPLQQLINRVLWALRFLVIVFGAYVLLRFQIFEEDPSAAAIYEDAISIIFSMAPGGILFMILMTYINGSARMAQLGALVPRAEAVETLAQTDVLCLGKGGTLTGAEADFEELEQPDGDSPFSESRLHQILGDYARSTRSRSRLIQAMRQSFDGAHRDAVEDVLFFSLVGWQGMIFDDDDLSGAYIIGRQKALAGNLTWQPPEREEVSAEEARSERTRPVNLLLAHTPQMDSLMDKYGRPRLPQNLLPLGYVSFSEAVEAEARATTEAFREARVLTKVLSMYQEESVLQAAAEAGITALDGSPPSHLSGKDLLQLSPEEYAGAVEATEVFSRLATEQKVEIIQVLQNQGDLVTMVGDGVADLSALRQANLAVTFRESGQAALSTADIILLDDTLSALPPVLALGQGVFNRLLDVLKLSLTHALTAVLLTFVALFSGAVYFPYLPAQNLAVTIFTLTLPAFALSFWLESGRVNTDSLAKQLAFFVLPAALSIAVVLLFSHVLFVQMTGISYYARVVVTHILVATGLMLLIFVQPPIRQLVAADRYSGDLRPTRLAIFLWFAFLACTIGEPLRSYFNLQPLVSGWHYLYVLTVVAVWALVLRSVWRSDTFRRMVGYHLLQEDL